MPFVEYTPTPISRLVDALEMYRKADPLTREYLAATLCGDDLPDDWHKLDAYAGVGDPLAVARLDDVKRGAEAIRWTLEKAGAIPRQEV